MLILEIGLKINKLSNVYAVDIGQNLLNLSRKSVLKCKNFPRCDCTILQKSSFRWFYSWGVFHHTNNFDKALKDQLDY